MSGSENDAAPAGIHCELLELEPTRDLMDTVSVQVLEAGYRPDVLVAIARGGLVPARFVADALGVSSISTMTVRHYDAGAHKNAGAFVAQPVNADISGRRVLIVDDVNDTGETFSVALPHVLERSPADVRTAVLHEKRVSIFKADFVGILLEEWRWLIYPWAAFEDVGSFVKRLAPYAGSRAELEQLLFDRYGLRVAPQRLDRIIRLKG